MGTDDDDNWPNDDHQRTQILQKLPLKTLFTSKSIFPQWNQLISDIRQPCLLHVDNKNATFRFTITSTQGNLIKHFTPPILTSNYDDAQWLFPCHDFDLVCFYTFRDFKIYLCNPITEQILPLPMASRCKYRTRCIGFGYSSKTHVYKVVNLFITHHEYRGDIDISCEIYSLGKKEKNYNHCWKTISEKCPYPTAGVAACVDEVLHWMPYNEYFDEARVALVSFDLNTEKFMTMPISQQYIDICEIWYCAFVRELAGKLCLVYSSGHEDDNKIIGVWMVKEYNEGTWEKLWEINLENLDGYSTIYSKWEITPIGYINNEENLILQAFGIKEDERQNYYSTETQRFTSINYSRPYYGRLRCLYWLPLVSSPTNKWAGPWLPNSLFSAL